MIQMTVQIMDQIMGQAPGVPPGSGIDACRLAEGGPVTAAGSGAAA
jgi:hypothetical protein